MDCQTMQLGNYSLDLNSVLGEGNNTRVVLGVDSNGKKVAVKVYNKNLLSEREKKLVEQEVRTLKILPRHPHIIQLVDVIEKENMRYIVNEYMDEGDLFEYLSTQPERLTERACKKVFVQIARTVNFLHRNGVVHHDIKLENTGIRGNGQIVLLDFGYSCEFTTEPITKFCGTLSYCSPELLQGKPYQAPPVDVWSMGVLLYALLAKRFPFDTENPNLLYKQATSKDYMHNIIQSIPAVNDDAKDLLFRMLTVNPTRRISTAEILRHKWLRPAEDGSDADIFEDLSEVFY